MNVPREVILEVLVRLKLEKETCKCERHAMDFYMRFSKLVTEIMMDKIVEGMYFDGFEHYLMHKDTFDKLFSGEEDETA